jgi:hypothetical protein
MKYFLIFTILTIMANTGSDPRPSSTPSCNEAQAQVQQTTPSNADVVIAYLNGELKPYTKPHRISGWDITLDPVLEASGDCGIGEFILTERNVNHIKSYAAAYRYSLYIRSGDCFKDVHRDFEIDIDDDRPDRVEEWPKDDSYFSGVSISGYATPVVNNYEILPIDMPNDEIWFWLPQGTVCDKIEQYWIDNSELFKCWRTK